MAVTAPTDVAQWIPSIISPRVYDTTFATRLTLSSEAAVYGELEGEAGQSFLIPTIGVTAPSDNLAVTTAAVDDNLTGGGVPVTVKESVKSIAFYDRTKWATGTDFNALAGSRVGAAQARRIELDLAAAMVAGATLSGITAAALNIAMIRQLRAKLPAALRAGLDGAGSPVLFGDDLTLAQLFADTTVANAAAFGSDTAIREGDFTRPIAGVRIKVIDDDTFPLPATANRKYVAIAAPGMLIRAMQKNPTTEVERDARARLTRIVGTQLHAEGVVDARGIILQEITV